MSMKATTEEKDRFAYTAIRDIDNTFIPSCSADKLSLNTLFLELRHGFCKVEDLPEEVRRRYEEALPYLRKRFHRE